MRHESDGDTNSNWLTQYQRIGTGTGGLRNKRTSEDHLNYSIVEISQNTKKSPGDLETCCHTNCSEKPSASVDVKNSRNGKMKLQTGTKEVQDLARLGVKGNPLETVQAIEILLYQQMVNTQSRIRPGECDE